MAVELLETLKEALTAYTGLSPNTFFTLLAAAIAVYYILSSDHHQQHRSSSSKEDVQSRSMASTSSSRHSIPPSNSQSWRYDVFLSFRGEDTRNTFVDHLYTAIEQKGIKVYKDDVTLPRGETIGPSLLNAIQESRIAVVVFSKKYADSAWCLDELTHIIECMDTSGQIVLPVFYHVDPSDVRKLKGKYKEAFSKHKRESKHKVESWRKALERAGNLSGWEIENSHEAKFITEIVNTIFGRLPSRIRNVKEGLIGMETRLQDLKSKLEIGLDGVRIVGIWGVGGGGKTTLADAAYEEIKHRFEAHFFLRNIREESNKQGLEKLQKELLSFVDAAYNKNVLVVLDDVDDLEQLEALAGSHAWFGEGSRIIITTRDKHLLSRHADKVYEVSLLSHDEAMELFRRHAYREDKPIEDYEMLSKDVVSYARGLPLALKVLGSFLYDKNKDEWNCALARLEHIPNDKVIRRLKISYDGLERDQQKLFLDIACYMRGYRKKDAMMYLDACSFYPGIGVKVLEQKSLIKVSNGRFDMHDLIQEMAHYIVRGEHPNNPEKYSRIWMLKDIEELCAMGAAAPSMETEVLDLSSEIRSYPDAAYSRPHLAYVVANMKKLRWINWGNYPASSFPSNFLPTKLGCLILEYSQQEQLWEGYKHLPNLKILDLSSSSLIKTPDFNGLPCLERLILAFCDLKEIHPSIGNHESLVYVDMGGCENLETFPPIVRMKKLETLILTCCSQLQQFPDIQSSMDNLVTLSLDATAIKIIPSSVAQFCTKLVSFDLSDCEQLKRIEGNFHLLKSLKDLNLNHFHYDSSVNLKFFQFPHFIRKLNLRGCNLGNGDIPSNICELLNLQILRLSGNEFSKLPSSISQIPCLKHLDLSDCRNLVELSDLPSSIASLKAEYCESLESVGDLSDYKCLWKVLFCGCDKLIGDETERLLLSMLEGNAVDDRFMSLIFPNVHEKPLSICATLVTSQLPHNWYSDFTGFLLCTNSKWPNSKYRIVIKHEMSKNSQPHHSEEEFDTCGCTGVGYVPFSSLKKHEIPWWDPTQNISLQFHQSDDFKVGLVRWKSNVGDLNEIPIDYSECWDEYWDEDDDYLNEDFQHEKTFKILSDSKSSSIEIVWKPDS